MNHTGFADDVRLLPQEHRRHLAPSDAPSTTRRTSRSPAPTPRRPAPSATTRRTRPANNYVSVPTSPCSACHQTDYNNAKTPVDHIASSFPTTCDSCHKFSDATWMQATFSHTTFPLVGVHATTACATCHNPPYAPSANNYTTVPDDLLRLSREGLHGRHDARAPHRLRDDVRQLPQEHRRHLAARDAPSTTTTYFALAGAHVTAPCSQCHNPPYAPSANNYISVPTSPCSACHLTDYNTATTPGEPHRRGLPDDLRHVPQVLRRDVAAGTSSTTRTSRSRSNHNVPCAQCHTTPNVYTVFNCIGLPHGSPRRTRAQRRHGLRVGVDGLLLLPPERAGGLMRRRLAILAALLAWGAPAAAQSALDWGRIAVFGQVLRSKNDDGTTTRLQRARRLRHAPHAAPRRGRRRVLDRRARLASTRPSRTATRA